MEGEGTCPEAGAGLACSWRGGSGSGTQDPPGTEGQGRQLLPAPLPGAALLSVRLIVPMCPTE